MAILKYIVLALGRMSSFLWPLSVGVRFRQVLNAFYTGYLSRSFRCVGKGTRIAYRASALVGLKYIEVGENTYFGKNLTLTAWLRPESQGREPSIVIGNECHFGDDVHITGFRQIVIGHHLLTGSNVLITDNAHGFPVGEHRQMPPIQRPISSRGPVVIGDNVWLGCNVCIMPGVHIGEGAVVGANSVVTKDVPPFSVVVGAPAKVVRQL